MVQRRGLLHRRCDVRLGRRPHRHRPPEHRRGNLQGNLGNCEDIGDLARLPLLPTAQNAEVVHGALPTEEGLQAKGVAGKNILLQCSIFVTMSDSFTVFLDEYVVVDVSTL